VLLAQMRTQILLKFLQLQPTHQRQHVRTDDHMQPSVDEVALALFFIYLLDMSVINAMILYINVSTEKDQEGQCHKKFRMELAHQLVQPLLTAPQIP